MPKIIGSSLAEHRTTTRRLLIAAFSELVEEQGFERVSLTQVASRAGVGRTALYNHFASKDELLLGYILERATAYLATMEESVRRAGPRPQDQLRAYVRDMALLGHENELAFAPSARALISPGMSGRIREHATAVEALLRRILAAGIAAGAWPDQDLHVTVALISSCLTSRRLSEDAATRETEIVAVQDFVLRAVGAAPVTDERV